MARWNFNLAPRIGLLPIRLGMSLSDAGSILGLNPSSVISEGSGMKRAVYGDIVILYADYTDTIFSISYGLRLISQQRPPVEERVPSDQIRLSLQPDTAFREGSLHFL
ncbi:hypothetical protein, partial [Deinococcus sp. RIT780]|uniref:hypothetical protein n=1 Tax=Deinococcus sp. RIT780 TaxID=2870472 RepID=UPI001C897C3C